MDKYFQYTRFFLISVALIAVELPETVFKDETVGDDSCDAHTCSAGPLLAFDTEADDIGVNGMYCTFCGDTEPQINLAIAIPCRKLEHRLDRWFI
jgi:hypothetical protein